MMQPSQRCAHALESACAQRKIRVSMSCACLTCKPVSSQADPAPMLCQPDNLRDLRESHSTDSQGRTITFYASCRGLGMKWRMPAELAIDVAALALYNVVIMAGERNLPSMFPVG